jgi:PadR family transcriptional regulator PadR
VGKQITEMLKGTLEGIVLAILSGRPAYATRSHDQVVR